MDNEIRVQKYIADCGLMSRRKAEEEILAGRIKVNGESVEQGRKIVPGIDTVEYLGKPVVRAADTRYVYIMLNKPKGYVTTMNDELGRKCVASLVADVGCRVYPCGRLDLESEGLLLLTNDGALANKLFRLNSPMSIDGYEIQPAVVRIISMKDEETTLGVTLFEGRNRQIRKMCEQTGLEIKSLKRTAIGTITLGNLKPGTWRHLSRAQVDYLKNYK